MKKTSFLLLFALIFSLFCLPLTSANAQELTTKDVDLQLIKFSNNLEGYFSLGFDCKEVNVDTNKYNSITFHFHVPAFYSSSSSILIDSVSSTNTEVVQAAPLIDEGAEGISLVVPLAEQPTETDDYIIVIDILSEGQSYVEISGSIISDSSESYKYFYDSIFVVAQKGVVVVEDEQPTDPPEEKVVAKVINEYWWLINILLIILLVGGLLLYFTISNRPILQQAKESMDTAQKDLHNITFDTQKPIKISKLKRKIIMAKSQMIIAKLACEKAMVDYEIYEMENAIKNINSVEESLSILIANLPKIKLSKIDTITNNLEEKLKPSYDIINTTLQVKAEQQKSRMEALNQLEKERKLEQKKKNHHLIGNANNTEFLKGFGLDDDDEDIVVAGVIQQNIEKSIADDNNESSDNDSTPEN